jgi:hypothetical protein
VQDGVCFLDSLRSVATQTPWDVQVSGVLFPGAQETWPLAVSASAYGSEITLEVSDLGRPGRAAAVTVTVPPRARIRSCACPGPPPRRLTSSL